MKKYNAPKAEALILQAEQMIATSFKIEDGTSTSEQLTRGGGWTSENWAAEEEE